MKGLLKNNFYASRSNAKTFSLFMLLSGIFVVAVISQPLLLGYCILGMVGFSVNAIAGIKKEFTSKWGKYKLTLPVNRADIVKSYFISQLIWLGVGILFAAAAVGMSWLLHGCPFDIITDALSLFALGVSISLFTYAFFLPLFYMGGEERSEAFLAVSLVIAAVVAMGIISGVNFFLSPGMLASLCGSAALLACSLAALLLSYPLAVGIYSHKEY